MNKDRGWFNTPRQENGKCKVCGATTTHKDKEGNWVDVACEKKFIDEKRGEHQDYE